MRKRVWIYWLRKCMGLHVSVPKGLLDLAIFAVCSRVPEMSRPYAGIPIVAGSAYKVNDLTEVVAALELIQTIDPRRFARIQQFIKRIFVSNFRRYVGCYRSIGQVCDLKKLQVPEGLRSVTIYFYASTLVHESTHGLLFRKRFPHSPENKRRIEKLCATEAARFLRRVPGWDDKWDLARSYISGLPSHRARSVDDTGAGRLPH